MSLHEVLFVLFAAVILVFSLMTVTSRRILRSATYLLFVLIATSAVYLWLQYEFMAAVQLSLYAGGIMVIIVFSILLTHHIHHHAAPVPITRLLTGLGVAVAGSAITIGAILNHPFPGQEAKDVNVNMEVIGKQMISTGDGGYALPFEVISILLLAVLIGSIVVAKKSHESEQSSEK